MTFVHLAFVGLCSFLLSCILRYLAQLQKHRTKVSVQIYTLLYTKYLTWSLRIFLMPFGFVRLKNDKILCMRSDWKLEKLLFFRNIIKRRYNSQDISHLSSEKTLQLTLTIICPYYTSLVDDILFC